MTVATSRSSTRSPSAVKTIRSLARWSFALGTAVVLFPLVFPLLHLSSASSASAQTQMQLNKEACDAFKTADAEMNAVYGRIRRDYRRDTAFVAALRKAQLAWIRYRDAHVQSIFPGDPSQYGSINTMCRCNNLAEITKARTQILNQWLEGIEEGDVCAGSVKVK